MLFYYQYRTADNVIHSGSVTAADREAAFAKLRQQGIRPAKLEEAPGFFNKLFGKGKRWIAIGILSIVVVGLCVALLLRSNRPDAGGAICFSPRTQIYGDPSFLQLCKARGWSNVFSNATECLLANFAEPGESVDMVRVKIPSEGDFAVSIESYLDPLPGDGTEVVKVKAIVNWMKKEARAYLKSGGTVEGYIRRLQERQQTEAVILKNILGEIELLAKKWNGSSDRAGLIEKWTQKNELLRDMGFATVPLPLEWEKNNGM